MFWGDFVSDNLRAMDADGLFHAAADMVRVGLGQERDLAGQGREKGAVFGDNPHVVGGQDAVLHLHGICKVLAQISKHIRRAVGGNLFGHVRHII